jgi:hypothetical protein
LLLAVAVTAAGDPAIGAAPAPPAAATQQFVFHTEGFWLNLHHFLYVLGRAQAGTPDRARRAVAGAPEDAERGLAALAEEERRMWREAVDFYAAGPSRLDAVFDDELVRASGALARAAAAGALEPGMVDEPLRGVLERAAPIYRRAWWPSHRAANQAWVAAVKALLDRHGETVGAFVTRAYGLAWPAEGFPVHLSGYANWAGAYSTRDQLLVISSLDEGNGGSWALETVFHEAMHQWDDAVDALLRGAAGALGPPVPDGLSHALIFLTAGEAARRAVPGHVPYAEANGLWRRGLGRHKSALDAAWRPWLDGQGTRDQALAALVRQATSPPPQN